MSLKYLSVRLVSRSGHVVPVRPLVWQLEHDLGNIRLGILQLKNTGFLLEWKSDEIRFKFMSHPLRPWICLMWCDELVANLTRNVSLVLHLRVFSNDRMTSPTAADRDSASSPSFTCVPRVVPGAPTLIDGQATLALTFLHCWSKWPRHCQKNKSW